MSKVQSRTPKTALVNEAQQTLDFGLWTLDIGLWTSFTPDGAGMNGVAAAWLCASALLLLSIPARDSTQPDSAARLIPKQ
jgi:hypothetical protein